jgi:hypothetical protein
MTIARSSGVLSAATIRSHDVTLRGMRGSIGLARIRRSLRREVGLIDASIFGAVRQRPFGRDQAARLFATTGNVAVVGDNVCASGHTKSPVATGTCMPVGRAKPAFQKTLQFRRGDAPLGQTPLRSVRPHPLAHAAPPASE